MSNIGDNKNLIEIQFFPVLVGLLLNFAVIALTIGTLLYLYSMVAEMLVKGFLDIARM